MLMWYGPHTCKYVHVVRRLAAKARRTFAHDVAVAMVQTGRNDAVLFQVIHRGDQQPGHRAHFARRRHHHQGTERMACQVCHCHPGVRASAVSPCRDLRARTGDVASSSFAHSKAQKGTYCAIFFFFFFCLSVIVCFQAELTDEKAEHVHNIMRHSSQLIVATWSQRTDRLRSLLASRRPPFDEKAPTNSPPTSPTSWDGCGAMRHADNQFLSVRAEKGQFVFLFY